MAVRQTGAQTRELALHPAKYNDLVLEEFAFWLPKGALTLDPFSGVGGLSKITKIRAVCLEIERDWATDVCGDALALPFRDGQFDALATSPVYGNRMSDHHNAKDASKRHTYTHAIGHDLHERNSGRMQWGRVYRKFHELAWAEAVRVLRPGGLFLLNSSDHIRKGEVQEVTLFHVACLANLGLTMTKNVHIGTPRLRHGSNSEVRADFESVTVLTKPQGA